MAINQLIAQGIRPIGADVPQIANMLAQRQHQQQQNALAQSELGIRQQNANLIANQQQAALAQREAEATKEQYGYAARVGYALAQAKTPEEFAMLADRVAADPQYQSIPGVFTREQMTPENVRATLPQVFAKAQMEMPQGPGEITTGSQGGFRYLQQGGKIVSSQAPDRPQQAAPEKPQLLDVTLPDGRVQARWVKPGQSTGIPVGAPTEPSKSSIDQDRVWRGEDRMKNDFEQITKDRREELSAARKVRQLAVSNLADKDGRLSPQSQQALIFMFGKVLDPQSVLREGEYDRIANARGYFDTAALLLDKVAAGDLLTKKQVNDIAAIAGFYEKAADISVKKIAAEYTKTAGKRGYDPTAIISDPSYRPGQAPAAGGVPSDISEILKKHGGK